MVGFFSLNSLKCYVGRELSYKIETKEYYGEAKAYYLLLFHFEPHKSAYPKRFHNFFKEKGSKMPSNYMKGIKTSFVYRLAQKCPYRKYFGSKMSL